MALKEEAVQDMIRALVEEDAEVDMAMQLLAAQKDRIQAALAPLRVLLSPVEPEFDGGLADACRQILKTTGKPMTPLEIRDGIKTIGYDSTKHNNLMASIHSVLKRMADSKESKDVKREDAKDGTRYSWIGSEPLKNKGRPSTPTAFEATRGEFIKSAAINNFDLSRSYTSTLAEIGKSLATTNAALDTSAMTKAMAAIDTGAVAKMVAAMQSPQFSNAAEEAQKAVQLVAKQLASLGKLPKL